MILCEIIKNIQKSLENNDDMEILDKDIQIVAELIRINKNNNIFFIGVGKNKHMCAYFSDVLKSIGYCTFILDATNLIHGDMGCIKKDDLVIFVSNSGNTTELVEIMAQIKNKNNNKNTTVSITSNNNSILSKQSNVSLIIPKQKEIDGNHNLIPSTSIVSFHLIFNAILYKINISDQIDLEEYHQNHPKGNIGLISKKIKDVIISSEDCPIVNEDSSIKDSLFEMLNKHLGCCFIMDKNNKVLGFITDYDIRTNILKGTPIEGSIIDIVKIDFHFESDINKHLKDIKTNFLYLPVMDKDRNLIGLLKN